MFHFLFDSSRITARNELDFDRYLDDLAARSFRKGPSALTHRVKTQYRSPFAVNMTKSEGWHLPTLAIWKTPNEQTRLTSVIFDDLLFLEELRKVFSLRERSNLAFEVLNI